MADYIKRTDVMKICESYSEHCFNSSDAKGQDIADRILDDVVEIPTADVEEVKHGEWELKSETRRFFEEIDEEFYVECPFCHRVYYVPFEFEDEKMLEYAKKNYPYCNCGAKMDGERRDT